MTRSATHPLPGGSRRRWGVLTAGVWLALLGLGLGAAEARGPDRKLYDEAQAARAALEKSSDRQSHRSEWERVVLAYRRVLARHPRSPYCDNALLAAGDLYRKMATRFREPGYDADAIKAYRQVVSEYPSSSLGERALFAVFEILRARGDKDPALAAGRRYLKVYPKGERAKMVKELMSKPVPRPSSSRLAQVTNLRFWSGDTSTRVVLDLDRQVKTKHDRIGNPDRLWVDLLGTRLHPDLSDRSFPVGDGLLEKVRIGPNREGVIRMVLDFKSVGEHNMFYLANPPRLVVDVHSTEPQKLRAARKAPAGKAPQTRSNPATPPGRTTVARTEPGTERPLPPPEPAKANRAGDRSLARQLGLGARRIVIDPGHGGRDPGSIGRSGLQEKDLVLDVSIRLAELIERELGAEVLLTRRTDRYIPLEERTAIANSKGADLFLSIHANSSRSRKARGIETYYLNFATDKDAEAVAARENAISAATLKDLQSLVKAITLNSKIDESRDFAASVHESMIKGVRPAKNRGVRTAPFYVLIGANMPSVLAEIAFVSNPTDEKLLRSSDYRQKIARSLLSGVRGYIRDLSPTETKRLTAQVGTSTVGLGGKSHR